MRFTKLFVMLSLLAAAVLPVVSIVRASGSGVPHYDHIFVLVEENHSFNGIIGNSYAPTFNHLARTYGLATDYFGTIHPSEGNYVSMVGGNSYGIADDNPYYTHTINNPSLVDQLEGANLTWKGYFQSMPHAGYKGICFPANCTGPLYASKHNGFLNFDHVQDSPQELQKLVSFPQLYEDLKNNQAPNFSFIVPDQCHDMHGAPPFCVSPGSPGSPSDNIIVEAGDAYGNAVITKITGSSMWSQGNNAIVIVWDEGNNNARCCDANPGGGHATAIVVTNHGPRSVKDNTPYNHYSLLLTIEQAFGLGCLQFTCDTANVTPMTPLFATS